MMWINLKGCNARTYEWFLDFVRNRMQSIWLVSNVSPNRVTDNMVIRYPLTASSMDLTVDVKCFFESMPLQNRRSYDLIFTNKKVRLAPRANAFSQMVLNA